MATNPSDNNLHLWRSKAIDSFAQAEAAIDLLAQKLNAPAKIDMLGQKIEALRKAKPNAAISDERKSAIDKSLAELSALLGIRNDIVHSPMVIEKVGEGTVATFANPNVQCAFSSFKRVLPAPRIQALANKVASLARNLETA